MPVSPQWLTPFTRAWGWFPPNPALLLPPLAGSLEIAATLAVSEPPLYDFLFDLVVDPDCGGVVTGCCLCPEDGLYRYHRADLDDRAHQWAADEQLDWPQRAALFLGIYNLSWQDDEVVFYWG